MAMPFKIESGVQLLTRLSKKPTLENCYPVLFQSGPKHGEVIEIFSSTTIDFFLSDIISEVLLSGSEDKNCGVLLFSCSGNYKFNVLLSCILGKLSGLDQNSYKSESLNKNDPKYEFVRKILSNFFLVEIYDAAQLYTTIHNLESILVKHPNIALILFEDIASFYWSEQITKMTKMDVYLKKLIHIIQKVTKDHKVTILYTRQEYFSSTKESIERLEPCADEPNFEKPNYRIQVVDLNDDIYEVTVRSFNKLFKKTLIVKDATVRWI